MSIRIGHEVALEDMIMNNLQIVQARGFPMLYKNVTNQFSLPSGKRCDILSYEISDKTLNCSVFELKKEEIGLAALLQVIGYGEEVVKHSIWSFDKVNIELYLVGTDVSVDLLALAAWGININIVEYSFQVDGIHFEAWKKIGDFPRPYWVQSPNEMITKPTDESISNFIKKLTNK